MNQLLLHPFSQLLALALVHFLWQAILLCLLLSTITQLFAVRAAKIRYGLSVGTLLLMALCPCLTIAWMVGDAASTTEITYVEPLIVYDFIERPVDFEPTATAHQPQWYVTAQGWLLLVWIVGVCVLGLRLIVGYATTLWIRRAAEPLPQALRLQVQKLGSRMGIVVRSRVYVCSRVGQAVAVGFLRPVVLVPVSWLSELPPQVLEAVIAHELAHIRRWDLWVNLVQRTIETLLFYHPAVWWLSRRLQLEREMCCDEVAAATTDRATYARSLESVARFADRDLVVTPSVLATSIVGGRKMKLLSRVRYVLGADANKSSGSWWPLGLLALILPFAALTFSSGLLSPNTTPVVADDVKRERGEGDRERGEREVRRDGDREGGERGDRDREERRPRDGDRAREDRPRDGAGPRERGPRDGDRPREGERPRDPFGGDGFGTPPRGDRGPNMNDREERMMRALQMLFREVQALRREVNDLRSRMPGPPPRREGDRPGYEGRERDSNVRRPGGELPSREGERGPRDGDRAREGGPRDNDRPRESDRPRDGDRREGDRPRDGSGENPFG